MGPATVITTDGVEALKEMRQQPGKDIIVMGSIRLAQSLIEAGLIDEYQLRVCSRVIGEGQKLFPNKQLDLNLVESRRYGTSLVLLRYQRMV